MRSHPTRTVYEIELRPTHTTCRIAYYTITSAFTTTEIYTISGLSKS